MTERPTSSPGSNGSSYDEIPYPSFAFPETHPNHLSTMAWLFGVETPPVESCRVLELGCGRGDNLIPMALELPEARFVGFDLSAGEIRSGREAAEAIGLRNIDLQQKDIMDVSGDLGSFDFIIAHGVFSWVPPAVRERILQICQQHLAPAGVACISYNTYPGWHLRGMLREMMLFHTRQVKDSRERISQSQSLISFLSKSIPDELLTYRNIFRKEEKGLDEAKGGDSYLFHEFLEENNAPFYFWQFMELAEKFDLQYLSEADITEMQLDRFSPAVHQTLDKLGDDVIRREQYLDFLKKRTFRSTLLCQQGVEIEREIKPERIERLHVGSRMNPAVPEPDIHSGEVVEFRGPMGVKASTGHPISKAAFMHLSRIWPQTLSFEQLQTTARSQLVSDSLVVQTREAFEHDTRMLAGNLMQAFKAGSVEMHCGDRSFTTELAERPVASPLARRQARSQEYVTNLRHEAVQLNDVNRQLVQLLDGTRTKGDLHEELVRRVEEQNLVVQKEGREIKEPRIVRKFLAESMDKMLQELGKAALLMKSGS